MRIQSYSDCHEAWTLTHKRKLARNTYLERDERDGKVFYAVRFHRTRIVFYMPDRSITLTTGGWWTTTTRQRINQFSPAKVWTERNQGKVTVGLSSRDTAIYTFADGFTFKGQEVIGASDPQACLKKVETIAATLVTYRAFGDAQAIAKQERRLTRAIESYNGAIRMPVRRMPG